MMKNIKGVHFLRNGNVCANHDEALSLMNSNINKLGDGESMLVRYNGINGNVMTIVGYKYGDGPEGSLTILDASELDTHTANTSVHVTIDNKTAWDAKADIDDIPDVSNYIDGVEYETDGLNHSIVFYHGTTYVDSIDADPFLVDGMVDDVRIENGNLIIDFNTASGKQDIAIPLTDIFDPEVYYTKSEVDVLLNKKEDEIYSLKKIVGDMGGNVTYDLPGEGKSFNTLMNNNGTVKLSDNVETGRFGPGILASNKVKLNLNNHDLTFTGLTEASSAAGILVRGTEEVTIGGKGTIDAGQGILITCNSTGATVNLTGTTTTYQTNRPNAELIYCYAGTINISGGTFKNNGSKYLFNCYDANYQNGTAKIIVTGGKFYDFDPGNNTAEGENTSFLAEGYYTEAAVITEEGVEHTVYTVKKS